jgi:hypothetical protein
MAGEQDVNAAASSTAEPAVEKPAEPITADKAPENAIPYARFKEVNEQRKQYERFGPPERVEQALSKLAYYEELERQAAEEAAQNADGKPDEKTAKDLADANQALHKIEPKLAKALAAGDEVEVARQARVIVGMSETSKICAEAGIEASKANVEKMSRYLKPIIEADPVIYAEWVLNPRQAVRSAYQAWQEDVTPTIERQMRAKQEADKQPLTKLPKAHAPTGSPPTGKTVNEPKTMKEAEASVKAKFARLEI